MLCGHRFCSRCMLGVVKFTCPEFPILLLKCPLCRKEQAINKWSFYELFHEHYPEGAMLLECDGRSCEGFCLAIWESIERPLVQQAVRAGRGRRARRRAGRQQVLLCEETTAHSMTYLPAVNYIHLLDNVPTSSEAEEPFDLRRLFDVLAQRVQCSKSAYQLLSESAGKYVPIRMLEF